GLIALRRMRFHATAQGQTRFREVFGPMDEMSEWQDIRDQWMTALALGRPDLPATRRKLLAKPDGFRMAVVQKAFDLKLRRVPTPARVRAALAGVALKRASTGELQTDIRVDGSVDAAKGRALAAELSRRPRSFSSDAQLLAALAAEALDAPQTDIGTLRLFLFRDFVSAQASGEASIPNTQATPKAAAVMPGLAPELTPPAAEPDPGRALGDADGDDISGMEAFADSVLAAAEPWAQGFPGRRKAYVSQVFDALHARNSNSALAIADFKELLIDAHRNGHIPLASADLRTPEDRACMARSEIIYKNTALHFIRLDT
ncbi:MAG: hypothetical protein AAFY64_04295, partial [Pseudomonadota bacterium]